MSIIYIVLYTTGACKGSRRIYNTTQLVDRLQTGSQNFAPLGWQKIEEEETIFHKMDEKNKQTKYVSFNLDARLYYVVDILGHSSRLKSHPLNRWSEMKPG